MEAQDAPNRPAAGVKNMTLLVKCIGIPIFGIALVLLGYTQLGLLREFIAFCRNEKLVVEQPSKSFGALRPGASAKISYSIKNIGDKPVSIIGVNTQCTCTAVAQSGRVVPSYPCQHAE